MAAIASDSQTTGKDFQSDGGCQWNFTDSDLMKTMDSIDLYDRPVNDKRTTPPENPIQDSYSVFEANQLPIEHHVQPIPQYQEPLDPYNFNDFQQPTYLQPVNIGIDCPHPTDEQLVFTPLESNPWPMTNLPQHSSENIGLREPVLQIPDYPSNGETSQNFNDFGNPQLPDQQTEIPASSSEDKKKSKPKRPRGRPRKYEDIQTNDLSFAKFEEEFRRQQTRLEEGSSDDARIFNSICDYDNNSGDSQDSFERTIAELPDSIVPPQVTTRNKKSLVNPEKKNGDYWAKRNKNNESAKRSRNARRMKEAQIYLRIKFLEKMCTKFSEELEGAKKEILLLENRLLKYEIS